MIVLIGFMGAGKTTIGYMLAERLGLPFVDIDLLIEQRHQRPIREIFAQDGEPAFRQLEHETIAEVLNGPDAVIALGGGAAEQPATRHLLSGFTVVHLQVSYEEALLRIGHDVYRPMLASNDVLTLFQRRDPVYRQVATLPVITTGRRPEAITLEIIAKVTTPPSVPAGVESVLVAPTGGAYQAHIGLGVSAYLADLLPPMVDAEQAFIITDDPQNHIVEVVTEQLQRRDLTVHVVTIPERDAKRFATIERVSDEFAELAAHKHDLVVGVGGDPVCDVAGFVSSIYNRGMPLALVPTTLEAQADSAIGGKNAIDLPQGRNLVGSVHQPVLVLSDVAHATADPSAPSYRAGIAEILKHGLIAEPELMEELIAEAEAVRQGDATVLARLVTRSARVKSRIVTADEREQGDRIHLNYGHTFAHAFEHIWGSDADRSGDAVALGMMAAAHLAHRAGIADPQLVVQHYEALSTLGLATAERFDLEQLTTAFRRDKKFRGGYRFVLLEALGSPLGAVAVETDALALAVDDLAQGHDAVRVG